MTAEAQAGQAGQPDRDLPVNRIKPAYAQVADQLRDLIVSGRLQSGDQLPTETRLSVTFGVSRSTIREALRSLSAQNLVHTSRGVTGGSFVAAASPGLLSSHLEAGLSLLSAADALTADELLEARELFEVPAARLAAQRRSADQLAALRAAISDEAQPAGRRAKFEHNTNFHRLVLDACGNRLVEVMTVPIFGVIRARFLRDDVPERFWAEVDDDHRSILERITDQDEELAAAEMRDHLTRLRRAYQLR